MLSDIINNEQTGFIKGRYIGENIRLIYDLIMYCDDNYIPGTLLFIDYEKAFDSLDWSFIKNTLSYFNFGNMLIQWVSVLYSNVSSCVTNNGFISKFFNVSRGVRQGCPLSPYLFIICTEIVNTLINSNINIKGIYIDNTPIKISQYADDTVIICDGSDESLTEINNVLSLFSNISGLKVNFDQSSLFPLGPFVYDTPPHLRNLLYSISNGPLTYLGISFTHHHEDFFKLNYVPKLSRIKHILQLW